MLKYWSMTAPPGMLYSQRWPGESPRCIAHISPFQKYLDRVYRIPGERQNVRQNDRPGKAIEVAEFGGSMGKGEGAQSFTSSMLSIRTAMSP